MLDNKLVLPLRLGVVSFDTFSHSFSHSFLDTESRRFRFSSFVHSFQVNSLFLYQISVLGKSQDNHLAFTQHLKLVLSITMKFFLPILLAAPAVMGRACKVRHSHSSAVEAVHTQYPVPEPVISQAPQVVSHKSSPSRSRLLLLPSPRPPNPRLPSRRRSLSPRLPSPRLPSPAPPSPAPPKRLLLVLAPAPAPAPAPSLHLSVTVPPSLDLLPSTAVTSLVETACSQPTPSPLVSSELLSLARSGTTPPTAVPVSKSPVLQAPSRPW